MNPAEYDRMAALEASHWWYAGVRDLVQKILARKRFQLPPSPHVLDAGCGTGSNLELLRAVTAPAYAGGFDLSELAVEYSRKRNPAADVYRSDLCSPELHVDELDFILCCDVLYTTPLDAAISGLRSLCDRLKRGGLLLLHLPAYNWLRSRHDLAVHTRQRFTTGAAGKILNSCGLRTELLTYRMFFLFPAVVLKRLPSVLWPPSIGTESVVSDLAPVSPGLNRGLTSLLRLENQLLTRGIRFPWGSSLVAIGRKP